jgi:hypothetical protein
MYICYKDDLSASTSKTSYDVILFNIPHLNWPLLEELFNGKNIDYDDLIIPTTIIPNHDLILNLGSYLFDYKFGFDPNSKACEYCCSDDYYIKIINELIDCEHRPNDKVLYCPNNKYQIITILKHYFENDKQTNYIVLSSIDFDCGRYHQDEIRKQYCIKWNGNKYIYDNINLFANDFSFYPNTKSLMYYIKDANQNNSLFQISLNKVRQLFFSNLIDIKNLPYDILHEL